MDPSLKLSIYFFSVLYFIPLRDSLRILWFQRCEEVFVVLVVELLLDTLLER